MRVLQGNRIKDRSYRLQVAGYGENGPGNLKPATCNSKYLFFKDKCTQIFKPTETNMEFYLRKRYRQR